jgi:hypothetical protein
MINIKPTLQVYRNRKQKNNRRKTQNKNNILSNIVLLIKQAFTSPQQPAPRVTVSMTTSKMARFT